MNDQYDLISDDEILLRRVVREYVNVDLPLPVQREGFRPTKRDIDGISLFRERFVSPSDVANGNRGPTGYYVVRLRASNIRELGLNILPNVKDDQLPGHSLIPEINYPAMKNDKSKSKELQRMLAKLANGNFAHTPDDAIKEPATPSS